MRISNEPFTERRGRRLPCRTREVDLVLRCARVHLTEEDRACVRRLAGEGVDWEAVYAWAESHGVLPLLHRSLKRIEPPGVPEAVSERLWKYAHSVSRINLTQAQELVRLLELFGDHGIVALPFKGVALASAVYGQLALRVSEDVDILIRESDFDRAERLLTGDAYRPYKPLEGLQKAAYRYLNRQFPFVRGRGEHALLVELHTDPAPLRMAPAKDVGALYRRARTTTLLGVDVPHLAPEDLLHLLCLHGGSKHQWEYLKWVCDVAETLRACPDLDSRTLVRRAREGGALRRLLLGLLLARDLLGAPLPHAALRQIKAGAGGGVEQLARHVQARRYTRADGSSSGLMSPFQYHFRTQDTPRARIRYVGYWLASLAGRRGLPA